MPTRPIAAALLPITQVHPNPEQPRKSFDLAEMEELKASIKERGLINPISVKLLETPSPGEGEGEGPHYLIMAGERRYRACCDLGWKEIDARVWPATITPEEMELLSLVENIQRTDLTAIERAKAYKSLTQPPYNLNQEELGRKVGKTQETISKYLSIAELPDEIMHRCIKLGLRHLMQICRLKTPEEQIELAKKANEEGWTVGKLKGEVNTKLRPPAPQGKGAGGEAPSEAPPDPAAEVWVKAKQDPDFIAESEWEAKFGPRDVGSGNIAYGWFFWIWPMQHSLARLAIALRKRAGKPERQGPPNWHALAWGRS